MYVLCADIGMAIIQPVHAAIEGGTRVRIAEE